MSRIEVHQEKKKVPFIAIILGISLSITLILSSVVFLLYPFPSKEKTSYFQTENPIIYNGKIDQGSALLEDTNIYVPFSFLREEIDPTLTLDKESNSIIVTTKSKVIQFPSDSLTYFVNSKAHSLEIPIFKEVDGEKYISFAALSHLYPFQVTLYEETGAVHVQKDGEIILPGTIDTEAEEHQLRLRKEPSYRSPYVKEVEAGDPVVIESEKNGFYFVRSSDGIAGFVDKKVITLQQPERITVSREEEILPKRSVPWPINLTWEAVYTKNPNTSDIPEMEGVNVVSPTWFELKNGAGDITNLGSTAYTNWAKAQGYAIWGLFSNDFDPAKTHEALQTFETRQKMIRQLLTYTDMYQLDGINIDFENVNYEDRELVTQFVRELTPYLHQTGKVVSMDITFISGSENWSKFYEREKLAEIVDYLIVMAYDEHWSTSPLAGSVASLPWVEINLQRLLEVVPNERLILGVPMYTRLWKEQDTEGGNIEVSSKAYSMDGIQEWLSEKKIEPIYDPRSGQFYAEYRDEQEKATYKVWLENEVSMTKRVNLVHTYQLAGIASWSRSFASDTIWASMNDTLRKRNLEKEQSFDEGKGN